MSHEVKLVDELPEMFQEIKFSLLKTASKYRVPNAEEFVDGWFSNAFMIVRRLDTGELERKVIEHTTEGSDYDLVPYDSKHHTAMEVKKSTKAYLKKAFLNDVKKSYKSRKRFQDYVTSQKPFQVEMTSASTSIEYNPAQIEDFISIVKADFEKLSNNSAAIFGKVNEIFTGAILSASKEMKSNFGNIVVIQDISENDSRKYFIDGFKADLEKGVRLRLANYILEETNPVLISRLAALINPKKKGSLQKKLLRYLFEHKNGMPARIRNRIK